MIYISIIIPTINRSKLLGKTLASIVTQTYPPENMEVIVVDNGSTDNTQEIVSAFGAQITNLQYHRVITPGLHAGRHAGMRVSSGEILVFADDDIEALPTWIEGISESFQDNNVALTGGKNIGNYESAPPAWIDNLWDHAEGGKYLTYFSLLDLGDNIKEVHPHFIFGCNFAIRKKILENIGGFHPDGMPEHMLKYRGDGETFVASEVQKRGYRTLYNPKASVKHWVPASRMNVDYLKKRAYAEGITQSYVDTRSGKTKTPSLISSIRKFIRKQIRPADAITSEIQRSFEQGYLFHQEELKKDTALLQWVMQKNYL